MKCKNCGRPLVLHGGVWVHPDEDESPDQEDYGWAKCLPTEDGDITYAEPAYEATEKHGSTSEKREYDLAELLWDYLPKDPEHPDRRRTGWGTKTLWGLRLSLERILKDHENKRNAR